MRPVILPFREILASALESSSSSRRITIMIARCRTLPFIVGLLGFLVSVQPAASHFLAAQLPHPADDAAITSRPNTGEVPPALVIDLLGWIAASTEYDTSGKPPQITFALKGDTILYESGTAVIVDTLHGAYDWPNRRIILVLPWDRGDPRDVSVLLHELTYHVQLSNRNYEYLERPEWEAYKLQEAYLAENEIDLGFDWLEIYFMSKCPRDIHPD